MKGFFPCRSCRVCKEAQTIRTNKFHSTVTGKEYPIRNFISCHTKGVVYLLQCECNYQYVGRTIRTAAIRIGEHLTNIHKAFPGHSVSQHFAQCHRKNPKRLKIIVIEKYTPHWRGSNLRRSISRRETFWIYELGCSRPRGLNIEWDINAHINNC